MPTPPYLILGFDADPADPNVHQIIADVEATFPPIGNLVSLDVQNTYLIEVDQSEMTACLREIIKYFRQKDTDHNGALRWYVQLCRSADVGIG